MLNVASNMLHAKQSVFHCEADRGMPSIPYFLLQKRIEEMLQETQRNYHSSGFT